MKNNYAPNFSKSIGFTCVTLLYALSSIGLSGCESLNMPPNKYSKVVIVTDYSKVDTIWVEYYKSLHLSGSDLNDADLDTKARNVKYFSILESKSISK